MKRSPAGVEGEDTKGSSSATVTKLERVSDDAAVEANSIIRRESEGGFWVGVRDWDCDVVNDWMVSVRCISRRIVLTFLGEALEWEWKSED